MKFSDRETKVMEKIIDAVLHHPGRPLSLFIYTQRDVAAARRVALKLKQSIAARDEGKVL